jgi:ribosome-associated protein
VDTTAIADGTIRLGQLLKLAGLVEVGGDAKAVLAAGRVRVNGEPEQRRGRQVRPGDIVAVDDQQVQIVAETGNT